VKFQRDTCDDRIALRIYQRQLTFKNRFTDFTEHVFTDEYREAIVKLLDENAAVALPNFPSFSIIEQLYAPEHARFRQPCIELIESFTGYLKKILIRMMDQAFVGKPHYKEHLMRKLEDIIIEAIEESEKQCTHDVERLLEAERRVFTFDPYYVDTVQKIKASVVRYEEDLEKREFCESAFSRYARLSI
jgi:hypothetical protein